MNKRINCLLLALLTLNSVNGYGRSNQTGEQMINFEKTKPYCIGRYVVDIPAEAEQTGQLDQYNSFLIKVKKNMKKADFDQAVEEVQKLYSTGGWFMTLNEPAQKIGDRFVKVIKGKKSSNLHHPFSSFGFVLDKGHLYLIQGGHSDMPSYAEISDDGMQHIIQNLRYRHENEIPKEGGQCITNGFIKSSGEKFRINLQTMVFEFKKYPTVILRFNSEVHKYPFEALIPRTEANLKKVTGATFKANRNLIRKGEKNTSLFTGQEWIATERMQGRNGISAIWEHTGQIQNNLDPTLKFEVNTAFDNAERIRTSDLSKEQGLFLYETILKSIRKVGE